MEMLSKLAQFARPVMDWGHLDREYRRDVLSFFEPNPEASLLDVGCGDGEFTLKVAGNVGSDRISGIEVVKEYIEQATGRGIDCYQVDLDASKLPFEDESFDVVCANQIIEHVSDTDGFAREVCRVLKPGGYAVISTPNLAAWHSVAALLIGFQPYSARVSDEAANIGTWLVHEGDREGQRGPQHRRIFTLRALKEFLQYHGFKVVKSAGSGYFPLPAPLARLACTIDKTHAVFITVKVCKARFPGAFDQATS